MLSFILFYCRLILTLLVFYVGEEYGYQCGWVEGYGARSCVSCVAAIDKKIKKNVKKCVYLYVI